MQISPNGDAPGANQMVDPVIDPAESSTMMLDFFITIISGWTIIAGAWRQLEDTYMGLLEILLIELLLKLFLLTLHIVKVVKKAMSFRCANLILIGAAVTMGTYEILLPRSPDIFLEPLRSYQEQPRIGLIE